MPPFGEACVCNPWKHRDSLGFVRFTFPAGGTETDFPSVPTKLRKSVGRELGRQLLYLHFDFQVSVKG